MSETALKKIDAHVRKNKIYIMEVDQVFCSKFKYTKSLLSHSPLKSDRKEEEGCQWAFMDPLLLKTDRKEEEGCQWTCMDPPPLQVR